MEDDKSLIRKRKIVRISQYVIAACILMFVFIIWASSGEDQEVADTNIEQINKDKSLEVWAMAQLFVEEKLKSPSRAKYPWDYKDCVKDLGDGRYYIGAYVDSENVFGAMVRTNFSCIINNTEGDEWICESLEFDEQ